jgi:hypothetical protein
MYKILVFVILFCLSGYADLPAADHLSDEPEYVHAPTGPVKPAASYEEALRIWKTAEDMNGWIGANFSYDTARAMELSETQRKKGETLSIYSPSEFFRKRAGICVDLARFGVETLKQIDPASDPKYLMIEFDPIQIKGNTLRLHWLAGFKRGGKAYFFADSKRPGYIAGPYHDSREFVIEYEQYRGRKIVAFRETESYQKKRRSQAMKKQASSKP